MRAVVQRVSHAAVAIDGRMVGEIGSGLLVLVGAHRNDTDASAKKLAARVANLRIFNDADGRMNLSLEDACLRPPLLSGGAANRSRPPGVLAVSNFTVYGDASQRRPSFVAAAPYAEGERLFDLFVHDLRTLGLPTQTGVFGADMQVTLTNDGPITIVVDC